VAVNSAQKRSQHGVPSACYDPYSETELLRNPVFPVLVVGYIDSFERESESDSPLRGEFFGISADLRRFLGSYHQDRPAPHAAEAFVPFL
jgi:hypothetical protein